MAAATPTELEQVVRFPPRFRVERFIEALTQIQGVREVDWEE
jgi:hypothetical protein